MSAETTEMLEALDLEYWAEREGLAFKMSMGSSGMQANMQECPSCGDRRWRTYLNADTGAGNCFVCNQSFNKAKFIHLTLGYDPETKAEWRHTFDHIREAVREQGWRPKRTVNVAVEMGEVKLPISFPLPTGEGQNLVYLEQRGIDGEIARFFHLRFCTSGWWNFTREDGSTGGQKFDNRVIIPVFDLDGELKTFQGRDVTGAQEPKYLFPKGLPGTGRFLLNGQNVQRARRVCMGEGFMDVASIKKTMDEESDTRDVVAVGSFGKHLSYGSMDGNDQLGRFLKLKAQGLQEVTIMWDGEWKAMIAACDAARKLVGIGLHVKIAMLPRDRDPNEVPTQVVRDCFWKATPYTTEFDVRTRLRNPYA